MNSDLLKRLFRAINQDNSEAIYKIALNIIEQEKNKGHNVLAAQLESLITQKISKCKNIKEATTNKVVSLISNNTGGHLLELPTTRKGEQPLFSFIEHSRLRHHMVLSKKTEERFLRIEQEYAAAERLSKFNLKPKKKILLYGEPGCGKTMGAERLAYNVGLPLLKVRFDALLSSYFGESASNLRTIFDTSIKMPCVLLIDECDFIATARNSKQDIGEASRIVNMFLQLLDEYEPSGLLVATTNLRNTLDTAIFRRFDETFELLKPTDNEIRKLLRATLSSIETPKNINWAKVANPLIGLSAADIVKIAQNSAKNVVLQGEKIVTEEDILKSFQELSN